MKVIHYRRDGMTANAVYIGRKSGKNHYGNPFKIGVDGNRTEVIQKFAKWIIGSAYEEVEPERRQWILDNLLTLQGKDLACYCAPEACHGDVYKLMLEVLS